MSMPPPPQAGLSAAAEAPLSELSPYCKPAPPEAPLGVQAQRGGLRGPTAGQEGRGRTRAQASGEVSARPRMLTDFLGN